MDASTVQRGAGGGTDVDGPTNVERAQDDEGVD